MSTKSRIGEFIDKLSDESSRINKALRLVSKGAEKVQQLGRFYNKVAPYFALPSIPPILLGKEKAKKSSLINLSRQGAKPQKFFSWRPGGFA